MFSNLPDMYFTKEDAGLVKAESMRPINTQN
jgi:hypothetical protein